MSSKTVPVSVRLSHEDAEFLNSLKINGAKTPSDKLRAIIAEKRRRNSDEITYKAGFQEISDYMAVATEKIRTAEMDLKMHSDLVKRSFEWLPDLIAYIVSASPGLPEDGIKQENLLEMEKGIADRIFRIIESVFQMGIGKWSQCYNPEDIIHRSGPSLELSRILASISKSTEGDN